MSLSFIENLNLSALNARPVNSGVRLLIDRSGRTYQMARLGIRLLVAILTFSFGLLLQAARQSLRHNSQPAKSLIEKPAQPSNTFVGTGSIDMFMEDYLRASDRTIVRFGCSDRPSAATALRLVRIGRDARLVEKTNVFDAKGVKIGERVVWDSGNPSYGAGVEWNEGARLFYIRADSLRDAITFEESQVWKGAGCWDFSRLK